MELLIRKRTDCRNVRFAGMKVLRLSSQQSKVNDFAADFPPSDGGPPFPGGSCGNFVDRVVHASADRESQELLDTLATPLYTVLVR